MLENAAKLMVGQYMEKSCIQPKNPLDMHNQQIRKLC